VYAPATCLASILRPTGALTPLGDRSASYTVIATGVPASITEDSKRTWDPATQTPRTVRVLSALIGSATDIRKGDRLRDDTHGGLLYVVKDVTQERSFAYTPDLDLDLGRVGGGE
jgi:hypothetical protein